MTGQELRKFVESLPDNCTIEWRERYESWAPVDPSRLRAVMMPERKMNEAPVPE